MLDVARAYDELAAAAGELAEAVEREDGAAAGGRAPARVAQPEPARASVAGVSACSGALGRQAGAPVSSQTDAGRSAPRRRCGNPRVSGSQRSRRVASEVLSALARSSSASTCSR